MDNIVEIEDYINGIPVLTIACEDAKNCPVVFFIHGFMGNKRHGVNLGRQLAEKRICCICIDAYMHGERLDNRLVDIMIPGRTQYPAETGIDAFVVMYESIYRTANDIDTLIKYYKNNGNYDMNRVGVAGGSFGANVAYNAAVNIPEIKAMVTLLGYPSFSEAWEDHLKKVSINSNIRDEINKLSKEIDKTTAFIKSIDPFKKLVNFFPKPLLMICGEKDPICPIGSSRRLYSILEPFYLEYQERIKLISYDIGHDSIPDMDIQCSKWFETFL